ncbi:MAG: HNH endonuclease [Candidatus Thiodiazotropha endolucinida]
MAEAKNMKADDNKLERIYRRTDGQCHICRKRLCFGNYGAIGKRGAWEIEHSRPRSKGGTDHLNNLYAACISCNRSKGNGTTASARGANGYRTAPLSKQQRSLQTWKWGAAGSLVALFVPPPLRLVAFVAGAAAGALLGHDSEPE